MAGDNEMEVTPNLAGHAYRIAHAGDTGAAVVRASNLLDGNYNQQVPVYFILNGATAVTVAGTYMRCSRAQVILAGSSGSNEGVLTIRQATTTANVFAVMPSGQNQTAIMAFTVPNNKFVVIRRVRLAITRANGSAGSAFAGVLSRRPGEVFRTIRPFELQTGASVEFTALGGDVLAPKTDLKFRIFSVSDNNTVVDGTIEYIQLSA